MFRSIRFRLSSTPSSSFCNRCFSTNIKTFDESEYQKELFSAKFISSPSSSIYVENANTNDDQKQQQVHLCKKCILIRHDLATGWKENHKIFLKRFPFLTLPLQFSERIFPDHHDSTTTTTSLSMPNSKIFPLTSHEVKTRPFVPPPFSTTTTNNEESTNNTNNNVNPSNEEEKAEVPGLFDQTSDESSSVDSQKTSKKKVSDLFKNDEEQPTDNNQKEKENQEEQEEHSQNQNQNNQNNENEKYLSQHGFAFPLDLHLTNAEIGQLPTIHYRGPIFWVTEEKSSLERFRQHVFQYKQLHQKQQQQNENDHEHENNTNDFPVIVGIDTESVPQFHKNKGNNNNTRGNQLALIQIATRSAVFLLRPPTSHHSSLRKLIIEEIFENPNVLKVGLGLDMDMRDIQRLNGWRSMKPTNMIDLQAAVKKSGNIPRNGLSALSAMMLGRRVSKTFQMSNWARNLGRNQMVYAATDAWLCLILLRRFLHCGLVRPFGEELMVGRQPLLTFSKNDDGKEEKLEDLFNLDTESKKLIQDSIDKNSDKKKSQANDNNTNVASTSSKTQIHVDGKGVVREEAMSPQQDHSCFLMFNMRVPTTPQHENNSSSMYSLFTASPLPELLRLFKSYGLVKEVRRFRLLKETSPESSTTKTIFFVIHCGSSVVADRISTFLNPGNAKVNELIFNRNTTNNADSSSLFSSTNTIISKEAVDILQQNEASTDQNSIEVYSDGYTRYQPGKKSKSAPSKTICFPKGTFVSRGDASEAKRKVVELLKMNGFTVLGEEDEGGESDKNENSSNTADYLVRSVYDKNKDIFIEMQTVAGSVNLMMKLNMGVEIEITNRGGGGTGKNISGKTALMKLLFVDKEGNNSDGGN